MKKKKGKGYTEKDAEIANAILGVFMQQRERANALAQEVSQALIQGWFPNGLPTTPGLEELQNLLYVVARITYNELEWAGREDLAEEMGIEISDAFGSLCKSQEAHREDF